MALTCPWNYYGVATISRLLKIIGLFCRISSLLYGSFAKETYNCKKPTNRSHPIWQWMTVALTFFSEYSNYRVDFGDYGVATISRLLKIIRLFGEYRSLLYGSLQKRPIILRSLLIEATQYLPAERASIFAAVLQCFALYSVCCSVLTYESKVSSLLIFLWQFPLKLLPPWNYQIQKFKFLGTNSHETKISIWICTARYWGILVSRFGGFLECSIFSRTCQTSNDYAGNVWE